MHVCWQKMSSLATQLVNPSFLIVRTNTHFKSAPSAISRGTSFVAFEFLRTNVSVPSGLILFFCQCLGFPALSLHRPCALRGIHPWSTAPCATERAILHRRFPWMISFELPPSMSTCSEATTARTTELETAADVDEPPPSPPW